ncbi:AraC family transcriptional regulator [Dokdonia sinensis]|uniref:AraC family transcriptional regulator n=1 Tax=Dokdonia sinensis TaxID=2479847 RepID=A0A3M0G080_9FLAO|nr:helix-turn-helix domain-containing protein [Dokdonia sinensis]RMB58038.1 AraC family transcriptional regulator [Dokdonia sinensis]
MQFLHDPNFSHSFFLDVTRIDYQQDMPAQVINDYGYSYIMFRYGTIDAFDHNGAQVAVPEKFIKGTGDFFTVKAYKEATWISIELPNHILHSITKIHGVKNRNKLIDLSLYVDDDTLDSLYHKLATAMTIEDITIITDHHLRSYYKEWSVLYPSVEIVNHIFHKKGKVTVSELADRFPYSERTLGRMFLKEVGAPPQRFANLVRFNNAIRALETQENESLQSILEKFDYYDQSHFEKDFKKFLGQNIKEYKNEFNPLLSNALARKYVKLDL